MRNQDLSNEESSENVLPEHRLIAAILARAVRDYFGINVSENSISRGLVRRQARNWIKIERTFPLKEFSFIWCCEMLKLCPRKFRKILNQMQGNPEKIWNVFDHTKYGKTLEKYSKTCNA